MMGGGHRRGSGDGAEIGHGGGTCVAAWRRWVAALAAVGVAAGGLGSVWAAASAPKVVSVAGVSCLSRRAPFVCWAPPGRSTLTVTLAAGSPSVTWYPEFYGPLAAMQPV